MSVPKRFANIDSSIRWSFFLLLGVLLVGGVSAAIGYSFGHESLKGVTQPNTSAYVGGDASQESFPRGGVTLLKESEILAKVKQEIRGLQKQTPAKKDESKAEESDTNKEETKKSDRISGETLPIKVEDQKVVFQVRSLKQTKDGLELDVSLQNNGEEAIEFLYEFLDVADNRGDFLPTDVRGLPTELQPGSDQFTGLITILGASEGNLNWFSLSLSDYPDQKITLEIPKILLSAQ